MTRISRTGIHWTLRILAVVAAFGMAGTNPSGREPAPESPLFCIGCHDGPVGSDDCCEQCHTTITGGSGYGGELHSLPCRQNVCAETHPPCGVVLFEPVNAAVNAQDADGLARLLREAPEQVALNEARQSIQVMDCAGEVVANFPTPSAVLSAVAAVNAAQQ